MRWSPPEQNAQPPSFGDGPLPVSSTHADVGGHPGVVERPVQLVDGVRAERVAHLGPVERDPHGRLRRTVDDVAVIGDVGQLEAVDRLPRRGVKRVVGSCAYRIETEDRATAGQCFVLVGIGSRHQARVLEKAHAGRHLGREQSQQRPGLLG